MKKLILCIWLIFSFNSSFAQWEVVMDYPDYYFTGIKFMNRDTGFVAGIDIGAFESYGFILKTIDGGENWNMVYQTGPYFVKPYCFSILNDSLMFAGGQDGALYKSIDNGNNWAYYSSLPGLNDIHSIKFLTPEIGFALWSRTTDGGYTWEVMGIHGMTDYSFLNDSTGVLSTGSGSSTQKIKKK